MKTIYKGDSRYEKIYEQMQLLGIQDVSSPRQVKNGTIVWRLPIKGRGNTHIEYASFASGYVRNQGNQCHSNWQINKRVEGEPQYFDSGKTLQNGKPLYTKWETRTCELIPIEIDRLEYMMKYVIKNDFIKRANMLYTDFVPKWQYKQAKENLEFHEKMMDEFAPDMPDEVTVIINGQKYKII